MFQHFGVARKEVISIQTTKKLRFEQYTNSWSKYSDFILKAVEINTGLPTDRRIDHSQQGSRNIDISNASLKSRCGKTSQIGHHASTHINKQRMTGSSLLTQCQPNLRQGVQRLMRIAGSDDYLLGVTQGGEVFHLRQTQTVRTLIRQDEKMVVRAFTDGFCKTLLQFLAQYYFLFVHSYSSFSAGKDRIYLWKDVSLRP